MCRQTEKIEVHEKCIGVIKGYSLLKRISLTLQGESLIAIEENTKELCVIKRASKKLYKNHVSMKGHCINEDFLKEVSIVKMLSKDPNAPCGFVRFKKFIEDDLNFYLIEEHGGIDLFDYIIEQNKKIKENRLSIKQWQLKIQYIMGTILETVNYFHTQHHLCHLDLSLENILINSKTMDVKICDFGLSLIFDSYKSNIDNASNKFQISHNFLCGQYAGKLQYKSPEMNERKPFDARLADVWAIGVILFIMLCGIPPFEYAHNNDLRFQYIINGRLLELIKLWKLEENIPKDAIDLLLQIFKVEKQRITMERILNHPYFVRSRQLMVSHKNCAKYQATLATTTSILSSNAIKTSSVPGTILTNIKQ